VVAGGKHPSQRARILGALVAQNGLERRRKHGLDFVKAKTRPPHIVKGVEGVLNKTRVAHEAMGLAEHDDVVETNAVLDKLAGGKETQKLNQELPAVGFARLVAPAHKCHHENEAWVCEKQNRKTLKGKKNY
jgi:hypothetical protein